MSYVSNPKENILNQIQADLAELQNHPDDLSHEQLLLFYERMCANITDYEHSPITIEVGVYSFEDEETKEIEYDFEEMANEFENKLAELDPTVIVMCSIESNEII
jgi:hypothetical protein